MERIIVGLIVGALWIILLVLLLGIAALPVILVDHQIFIFDRRSFELKKI